MISALEGLPLKKPSIFTSAERQVKVEEGLLYLDGTMAIVAVTPAYKRFHHLFNNTEIKRGTILGDNHFSDFPESFIANFKKAIYGYEPSVNFCIQYLGIPGISYDVHISPVQDDSLVNDGVIIKVQKNHVSAPMTERSPDFYKHLVDHSTAVYMLADEGMKFTYVSKAITRALGYDPQELIGVEIIEIVHPEDKEEVAEWLVDLRKPSGRLICREFRVINKPGEYIWVAGNAINMLENATVNGFVINLDNIQAKKIADQALVQAEQRLSLLLNNTEESFIILNSRLRIITYNKAAQDRSPFFYNKELQSGLSVLDFVEASENDEYISLFEDVFKGKVREKETKFVDAAGTDHIYSHSFRPLFTPQNDIFGVFITSTDVTDRRKLTEEVAANSERLKTAQKIARLGYFEYDFNTKAIFCSDQFYDIIETPEIKHWAQFAEIDNLVHPDDRRNLNNAIRKSVSEPGMFSLEFRLKMAEGRNKTILAIGGNENNKFRITLQDITDLKMALHSLEVVNARFKTLFENSIDGVVISGISGEIISANPAFCHMLGYSGEEAIKLSRHCILDINSSSAKKMMSVRNQTGSYVGDLQLIHKNGQHIPVEITSIIMKDGDEEPYYSTIIRNVTEKKKIEEEQKALTEELLKNNQDLQQFSFITSHNLRAPVANLISLLSLYNKEQPEEEFNKLIIEKFEEATQQLNQTLNDLVNVLVIKSNNNVEVEAINFNEIFHEVHKNVSNLLREQNGRIEVDFAQVESIAYNRIHIESIFLNMISNAIKYSSPERSPLIRITSYKERGFVVISFEDNGLGMDLNRYGDRLFGLYQRFHAHKEGKGLGLYMTRSQVMARGGRIEVSSETGKGTTFKVYLKH